MDLDQTVVVIESVEELSCRPRFTSSLSFHPKSERRFGTVVAPYHFRAPIACGIESCHTQHMKGYLITTSDDLETGIGVDCGRKHFGVHFTRQKKQIDDAVQRKRRIDTVMRAVQEIPAYLVTVRELKSDYQYLTGLKRRFMDAVGLRAFTELKERADRGNAVITKMVPMTKSEAEAHFATTNRKKGDRKDWPEKEVPVARLEGLDFIRTKFTDMLVTNLIKPLENFALTKPADVEAMRPRALQNEAKWIGKVPGDIAKAREVIQAGYAFFTSENLMKLVYLEVDIQPLGPMLQDLRDSEAKRQSEAN